jgi:predicted PurR-regulated permease PerM
MAWYFFSILVDIAIAAIVSLVGQPLVDVLSRLRFKKHRLPLTLSALITLIVIILLVIGFLMTFVPLIANQAGMISRIDANAVMNYFSDDLKNINQFLLDHSIIPSDQTIQKNIEHQINELIGIVSLSKLFNYLITTTSSFFVRLFAVIFLSFFFLRDRTLLKKGILLFTPDKYQEEAKKILTKTKVLLSRYFIGLLGELLTMMTLLTIGLSMFGIENALLIGFLGGLVHVIPYLGPIIGATIGLVLGVSSALSFGEYGQVLATGIKIVGTFAVVYVIDNMVVQPAIYSKSVHAHPIEIFLVILMAGSLAGIPGMILAIPGYTVLRIVAKEFLSGFKLIDKLTENI